MSDQQQQRDTPTTSQTLTTSQSTDSEVHTEAPRILRLRGGHTATGRSVQWAEDVVDNEGLGRKSSKVCCIYHKPKAVDESSDESSSDSSSSGSDSDSDAGRNKGDADGKKVPACGHSHRHGRGRRKKPAEKQKRPPSPNAYEKVPKQKPKDEPAAKRA